MMKELRSLLIAAAGCIAGMLVAVLLLLGGHDPVPVAQIYVATSGSHFRVRDCQPLERDNQYIHACSSSFIRSSAATVPGGRLEQASAVGFALTRNCNLSGPGFRPCMQRFVRIGSKATGRSVQFMAYAPMQPGTFLLDLKNATR